MNEKRRKTASGVPLLFLIPSSLEYRNILKGFFRVQGKRMEAASLRSPYSLISADSKVAFLLCGIGKKKARKNLTRFLNDNTTGILVSTGCCGAVHPSLSGKTVLLPDSVFNDHREPSALCQKLFGSIVSAVRCPALLSLSRPADRDAKKALREKHPDVWAVDMESFWIAKAASRLELPCAVLRVTADRADQNIPAWGLSAGGRFRSFFSGILYKKRAASSCRLLGRALGLWYESVRERGPEDLLRGDDPSHP